LKEDIEKSIKLKNIEASGLSALKPRSKKYLVSFFFLLLNKTMNFLFESIAEIKREVPL